MRNFFNCIKNKIFLISCSIAAQVYSLNYAFADTNGKNVVQRASGADMAPLTKMITNYVKLAAVFITILALGSFVYNIILLGAASTNTNKREQAIRGMLMSGAVAAGLPFTGVILQFLMYLR